MEVCLWLKESSLSVSVSLGGKCNLVYLGRSDTSCSSVTVQLMQLCHANWLNTQSVKCRTDYKWDGEVGISCWSTFWGCCDMRCVSGDDLLAESSLLPLFSLQSIWVLGWGVVVVVVFLCIQKLDKTNKSVLKLFELTFCGKLSFILCLTKLNTFPYVLFSPKLAVSIHSWDIFVSCMWGAYISRAFMSTLLKPKVRWYAPQTSLRQGKQCWHCFSHNTSRAFSWCPDLFVHCCMATVSYQFFIPLSLCVPFSSFSLSLFVSFVHHSFLFTVMFTLWVPHSSDCECNCSK